MYGGGSEDDDSDNEVNETPIPDIQPTFKKLVLNAKGSLYDCIIKGPPITSNKAQDNTLLIAYLRKLNKLHICCKTIGANIDLLTFPIQSRDAIKELLLWLTDFSNKNEYVDIIPYYDYLEVQLIRYPFNRK